MSDNSHSTGSSGSSTNSWTLLSPEEAAVENVGPVDDGTESLGDAPSLSEDVTGAAVEFKPSDTSIETVLSEEGHQVCQETAPESGDGPIPSSPSRLSPLHPHSLDPSDLDLESQPPVIHDMVTSSPSDNEPLGATPFVTTMDLGAPLDLPAAELLPEELEESCSFPSLAEIPVSAEHVLDAAPEITLIPASPVEESPVEENPVFTAIPEVSIPTVTLTASDAPSDVEADVSAGPENKEPTSHVPQSPMPEIPVTVSPAPETVGAVDAEEEEEEVAVEEAEREPVEPLTQDRGEEIEEEEPSSSLDLGDTTGFDDGLRRRNVPSFEALRPRTSDEEDEEEEVEFKLAERKEEKPWFSLNKCIVGALILLFLGSLFLSGDFDGSDEEQSQDWLSSDPQDMKELLDKLTQENHQIAQLEAQLQSQKEELDSALKTAAANDNKEVKAGMEKENMRLREELSSLPELKKELESLRARVTELNQLTADQVVSAVESSSSPHPAKKDEHSNEKVSGPEKKRETSTGGRLKEELQRQKVLLEESRERLQGMKKDGGDRKRVRDSLEEIQKKLSDQVERWGKKKPQEVKWKGNKGKTNEREHLKKDERKEWRGEKDRKHGKDGGWKEKEEKKEWRSEKQNSHKEAWRKHQDEWERKKWERKTDREERRKEKPWHGKHEKNSHHHHQHQHQHQQPRQPQQHNQIHFWKDQEQKLKRNILPAMGCFSSEECAAKEGLYPVELPEFEELLEGYLSKLEGSSSESKDKLRKLTAGFFESGVFIHDRVLFSDFAEDVADILEDMVDVLENGRGKEDDSLEEAMEEFEREALWKFAATA